MMLPNDIADLAAVEYGSEAPKVPTSFTAAMAVNILTRARDFTHKKLNGDDLGTASTRQALALNLVNITAALEKWEKKAVSGDRYKYTAGKNREHAELSRVVGVANVEASALAPESAVLRQAREEFVQHVTKPWTNPESPFASAAKIPSWVYYAGAGVVALAVLRPYVQPVLRRL